MNEDNVHSDIKENKLVDKKKVHSDIKEKDKLVNKDNAKYNPDEEIGYQEFYKLIFVFLFNQ